MSESVHYVTNQQGERVGVLLDLETYHRLTNPSPSDAELLADLSLDELRALAESILASKAQAQLDELLTRNAENQISADEIVPFTPVGRVTVRLLQMNRPDRVEERQLVTEAGMFNIPS